MVFQKYSEVNTIPSYIDIRQSTIKGAQKGAFANCDIPKGTVMGEYLGKIYKGKDMEKATGEYLFSVLKNGKEVAIIDAKHRKYSSWVRFVNTPQTQRGGNAHFFQYGGRIFIKASKDIPAGQEILSYYGDNYVDERLKQYFTKSNKPKVSTKKTGKKCSK